MAMAQTRTGLGHVDEMAQQVFVYLHVLQSLGNLFARRGIRRNLKKAKMAQTNFFIILQKGDESIAAHLIIIYTP